jgi:hypothetical protein
VRLRRRFDGDVPEPSSPVKSAWLRLFDLASSSLLVSAMSANKSVPCPSLFELLSSVG